MVDGFTRFQVCGRMRPPHHAVRPGYVVPNEAGTMIGQDLFRLQQPPPRPDFLSNFRNSDLATEQLHSYFEALDLTRPSSVPMITLESLDRAPGRIWNHRPSGVRVWTPIRSSEKVPENLRRLPPVIDMPKFLYSIWFGGPVVGKRTRAFREGMEELALSSRESGFQSILWTDVIRMEFVAAEFLPSRTRDPGVVSDNHLENVRAMMDWATDSHIWLINVDEVFHADSAMPLGRYFRMALNNRQGRGYAAARDILRIELMRTLGGVYDDPANRLENGKGWIGELWKKFTTRGYTIRRLPGANNYSLLGARGHPFYRLWESRLADKISARMRMILGGSGRDR